MSERRHAQRARTLRFAVTTNPLDDADRAVQRGRLRDVAAAFEFDGVECHLDEPGDTLAFDLPVADGPRYVSSVNACIQGGDLGDVSALPRHLPVLLVMRALSGDDDMGQRLLTPIVATWLPAMTQTLDELWDVFGERMVAAMGDPTAGSPVRRILYGRCSTPIAIAAIRHGAVAAIGQLCTEMDDEALREVLTAAAEVEPRGFDATLRIRKSDDGNDFGVATLPGAGRIGHAAAQLALAVVNAAPPTGVTTWATDAVIARIADVAGALARLRKTPRTLKPGVEYAWMSDEGGRAIADLLAKAETSLDARLRARAVGPVMLSLIRTGSISFVQWRDLLKAVGAAIQGMLADQRIAAFAVDSSGSGVLLTMHLAATMVHDAACGGTYPLHEVLVGAENLTDWMSACEPAGGVGITFRRLLVARGAAALRDPVNADHLRHEIEEWHRVTAVNGRLCWVVEELWWRRSLGEAAGFDAEQTAEIARPLVDEVLRRPADEWAGLLAEGISARALGGLTASELLAICAKLCASLPNPLVDPDPVVVTVDAIEQVLAAASAAGSVADVAAVDSLLAGLVHYGSCVAPTDAAIVVARIDEAASRVLDAWAPIRVSATAPETGRGARAVSHRKGQVFSDGGHGVA